MNGLTVVLACMVGGLVLGLILALVTSDPGWRKVLFCSGIAVAVVYVGIQPRGYDRWDAYVAIWLSAGACDGVFLRLPADSDVAWITEACADRELSRWTPAMPHPYSEDDARSFVEHAKARWEEGGGATFAIAEAANRDGLGVISLHLTATDPGLAGIGYWLREEGRGRGAATAAVKLVAGWAFTALGVERLHLTTLPDNAPSQRVAERAGFTREGILRAWVPTKDGRRDAVMYSLLADDLAGQ